MSERNSYYSIACDEFMYFRDSVNVNYCNPAAAQAQQIVEKMLKSVAELVCTDIEHLMKSYNLRALYDEIHKVDAQFILDRNALSTLKDYYFDARYPGDNFVVVTPEELQEAIEIVLHTVQVVENWREQHGYEVKLGNVRELFKPALVRLTTIKEMKAF